MNWGKKILIFYGAFVVGIIFLVFKSMQMEQDLVAPDYYAQELKYQQRIDEKRRAEMLDDKVVVTKVAMGIDIQFPETIVKSGLQGEVWIYCPNDEKLDKKVRLELKPGEKNIKIDYPFKGFRQIKITCETDGMSYYFEEKIYL
jgi:hypothetical protein